MSGRQPDGWRTIVAFAGGEVVVNDAGDLVVLANPCAEDEEHHCDVMGCGQAHVMFRTRPARARLAVGEILATTPRGTIAEYNAEHDGAYFRQTRLVADRGSAGMQSRWFVDGIWHSWRGLEPNLDAVDLRRSGRVVEAADADDDPNLRGTMPRDGDGA